MDEFLSSGNFRYFLPSPSLRACQARLFHSWLANKSVLFDTMGGEGRGGGENQNAAADARRNCLLAC